MIPALSRLAALGALCLALPAAGGEPAVAGAEIPQRIEVPGTGDDRITVDLYGPAAGAPALVLIAHGFTRNRSNHAALARELAHAGFAVAAPELPHLADHAANARSLGLVADALSRASPGPGPGFGALPVIYAGFSAGGTAALAAAVADPRALGWIGLDPVDRGGLGAAAASRLDHPAYVFHAPANRCNAQWNAAAIVAGARDVTATEVPFASHCDFEGPTDALCELACGAPHPGRQAAIRTAVVEAAEALVARGGRARP